MILDLNGPIGALYGPTQCGQSLAPVLNPKPSCIFCVVREFRRPLKYAAVTWLVVEAERFPVEAFGRTQVLLEERVDRVFPQDSLNRDFLLVSQRGSSLGGVIDGNAHCVDTQRRSSAAACWCVKRGACA